MFCNRDTHTHTQTLPHTLPKDIHELRKAIILLFNPISLREDLPKQRSLKMGYKCYKCNTNISWNSPQHYLFITAPGCAVIITRSKWMVALAKIESILPHLWLFLYFLRDTVNKVSLAIKQNTQNSLQSQLCKISVSYMCKIPKQTSVIGQKSQS